MAKQKSAADLAAMLAPTLGNEKAEALVNEAVERLQLDGASMDRDSSLRVLEKIAKQPGIASIAARFAKSRLHLEGG